MTWSSLEYRDGSANLYRFRADGDGAHFEYVPVTPAESSTGLYSGGPPRSGRLDRATIEDLLARVRAFERDRTLHVEERAKGTGAFDLDGRTFLLARGPALADFDAFVGALGS